MAASVEMAGLVEMAEPAELGIGPGGEAVAVERAEAGPPVAEIYRTRQGRSGAR